jgi:hypothetical protein
MKLSNLLAFITIVFISAYANFVSADSSVFMLPPEKGAALFKQCSRYTPVGVEKFWKPRPPQIAKLEKLLEPFLKSTPTSSLVDPSLTNFHRQYIGFDRKGKHYIYGNFYPANLGEKDEATQPIVVCDGGNSFWGVVYAVEAKTFQELLFNGSLG